MFIEIVWDRVETKGTEMSRRELPFCYTNRDWVYSFFVIWGEVVLKWSKISAVVGFLFPAEKRLLFHSYLLKTFSGHKFAHGHPQS